MTVYLAFVDTVFADLKVVVDYEFVGLKFVADLEFVDQAFADLEFVGLKMNDYTFDFVNLVD